MSGADERRHDLAVALHAKLVDVVTSDGGAREDKEVALIAVGSLLVNFAAAAGYPLPDVFERVQAMHDEREAKQATSRRDAS